MRRIDWTEVLPCSEHSIHAQSYSADSAYGSHPNSHIIGSIIWDVLIGKCLPKCSSYERTLHKQKQPRPVDSGYPVKKAKNLSDGGRAMLA